MVVYQMIYYSQTSCRVVYQYTVMYQFNCTACTSWCTGKTFRYLSTRIREHDWKKLTYLSNLLKSPSCKGKYSPSCFKIIGSADITIFSKFKEAPHINKTNPDFNELLFRFNTVFSFIVNVLLIDLYHFLVTTIHSHLYLSLFYHIITLIIYFIYSDIENCIEICVIKRKW